MLITVETFQIHVLSSVTLKKTPTRTTTKNQKNPTIELL